MTPDINVMTGGTSQCNSRQQRVANFPGVTVEHAEGSYVHDRAPVRVLDLPGTYSPTPQSPV